MADTLRVTGLGGAGDGIAESAGGPVYVPFALPGEIVTVERAGKRARLISRETDAPERIDPFCPYFGTCGGCVAQHMATPLYGPWKTGILDHALAAARVVAPVGDLVDAQGAGRRRLTFHARSERGRYRVGFMRARSHEVVEIESCPVAEPRLAAAPAVARSLVGHLGRRGKPLDIQVTASDAGFDIDIRGHGPPADDERQALIAEAGRCDVARLSIHGEVLVERRAPVTTMGRGAVVPPAGGFLQATRAGESALAALVLDAVGEARRIADLFAGCGTFSLRLGERAEIRAVEQDGAALAALERAWRATPGLRRLVTEPRDLHRRPLLAPELAGLDAVVLDPPRAGAEPQCRHLALAPVPRVVMVSCYPATFARDAAILISGGYNLEAVTPVDQFKYTAHLEMVGVFGRAGPSRRRGKK